MKRCWKVSDESMSDDRSYPDKKKGTLRSRLAYWTAEVALVFVGVAAAFWLNNY
jgi:hypothetical protein